MIFNASLAEQVLGQIKAYPESHVQGAWRCESGMCFAGWTAQLTGYTWAALSDSDYAELVIDPDGSEIGDYDLGLDVLAPGVNISTPVSSAGRVARKELNIDHDDADILFYGRNTVENLEQAVKHLANGDHITFSDNLHSSSYEIVARVPTNKHKVS